MKQDEHDSVSNTERTMKMVVTVVIAVVVFGALYIGVRLLQ